MSASSSSSSIERSPQQWEGFILTMKTTGLKFVPSYHPFNVPIEIYCCHISSMSHFFTHVNPNLPSYPKEIFNRLDTTLDIIQTHGQSPLDAIRDLLTWINRITPDGKIPMVIAPSAEYLLDLILKFAPGAGKSGCKLNILFYCLTKAVEQKFPNIALENIESFAPYSLVNLIKYFYPSSGDTRLSQAKDEALWIHKIWTEKLYPCEHNTLNSPLWRLTTTALLTYRPLNEEREPLPPILTPMMQVPGFKEARTRSIAKLIETELLQNSQEWRKYILPMNLLRVDNLFQYIWLRVLWKLNGAGTLPNQINASDTSSSKQNMALSEIDHLDKKLFQHFKSKFVVQTSLTRPLVSFQANKTRSIYRWYKYKEAFSASLVEYLFNCYKIVTGKILDPFAGSGTALFVASAAGINAEGIELLPIGQQIIATKKLLESDFTAADLARLKHWSTVRPWTQSKLRHSLPELRITKGAYSELTLEAIETYLGTCQQENERVQTVLRFALLCILESVSYTRKDGQYLRWDYRSGRRQGKKLFDKGLIFNFEQAICTKIDEITFDLQGDKVQLELFPVQKGQADLHLYSGSCLEIMPKLVDSLYDAVITSPPYCNRYDYTRTYALELALLGVNEQELLKLRQQMLSCTVENRAKDLLKINPDWVTAIAAADQQVLLQTILKYLDDQKVQGVLNNNGIPRMVRGYFYEMACVIAECARVMKSNALLIMVNDNVRYAGASVSVDMILSNIAEKLGFHVENILVLPDGKGNSSQQMGEHGRESLRKCVYVWRKL